MMLCRENLRALRTADRISFHFSPTSSTISAIFSEPPPREDRSIRMDIDGKVGEINYGSDSRRPLREVAVGHHLLHVKCGGARGKEWQTIASFLKVGDQLRLEWNRDYDSTGNMKDAGLHGDRLELHISRPGHRPKEFAFIIATQCCPDNTARMIRRGVYNNE